MSFFNSEFGLTLNKILDPINLLSLRKTEEQKEFEKQNSKIKKNIFANIDKNSLNYVYIFIAIILIYYLFLKTKK